MFQPYRIKHPSGLVGVHHGTHLSIYGRDSHPVASVVFSPRIGWPDTMDAIEALDDTSRLLRWMS